MFEIFQYSAHAQIQNTVGNPKKAEKTQKYLKQIVANVMKLCKSLYIRHHMTSHEYYQCNTKRKIEVQ